ncbi:hypothetical protein F750_4640 [Streptomyces sp. PAMC 26508]|nr:hypothetical protein F750_4640 [Streptomyces sp. PAMC 26508]
MSITSAILHRGPPTDKGTSGEAPERVTGRGDVMNAPAGPRHPHGRTFSMVECSYIGATTVELPPC